MLISHGYMQDLPWGGGGGVGEGNFFLSLGELHAAKRHEARGSLPRACYGSLVVCSPRKFF